MSSAKEQENLKLRKKLKIVLKGTSAFVPPHSPLFPPSTARIRAEEVCVWPVPQWWAGGSAGERWTMMRASAGEWQRLRWYELEMAAHGMMAFSITSICPQQWQ